MRLAIIAILLGAGFGVQSVKAETRLKPEIVPLVPNTGMFTAFGVSPNERYLISLGHQGSGRDGQARLWDLESGRLVRVYQKTGPTKADGSQWFLFGFSPDSKTIITLNHSSKALELIDLASGNVRKRFEVNSKDAQSAVFSPDGRHIAVGRANRSISIWDAKSGRLVRSLVGHQGPVTAVGFSPEGEYILSGADDQTVRIWRLADGKHVRTLKGHKSGVKNVWLSSNGKHIVSIGEEAIIVWEMKSGRALRTIDAPGLEYAGHNLTISRNRDRIALGARDGSELGFGSLQVWDMNTGNAVTRLGHRRGHHYEGYAIFPDGRRLVQGSGANTITVFDIETGKALQQINIPQLAVESLRVAPNGDFVVQSITKDTLLTWDLRTGKPIRKLRSEKGDVSHFAISPDGKHVIGSGGGGPILVWESTTGRMIRMLEGTGPGRSLSFTPDGKYVLSNGPQPEILLFANGNSVKRFLEGALSATRDSQITYQVSRGGPRWELWGTSEEKLVKTAEGRGHILTAVGSDVYLMACKNVADGADGNVVISVLRHGVEVSQRKHNSGWLPCSSTFFSDHERFVVASAWGELELWGLAEGRIQRFEGHANVISTFDVSRDGERIVSGGPDGIKVWSPKRSEPLINIMATDIDRWLAVSPSGLFSGTPLGNDLFSIVRGLELFRIDQIHQSLFSPDLIRETLLGDPTGEVQKATNVLDLGKVLDSGPAPTVVFTSSGDTASTRTDLVSVHARITDRGKGIGRIEWRINGVTSAINSRLSGNGPDYVATQELALDPGENTIEVVAYNASNLLASLPARTTFTFTGPTGQTKPKLHILAIGINAYTSDKFSRLNFAAKDARSFGAAMQRAAVGLYDDVQVTYAIDNDATAANLDKVVEKLGREVAPRDTFIFFASAHGYSRDGRFYLIPKDYPDGLDAIDTRAVGQDKMQDWIANRIKAKKVLILLDTCESGALVAGHTMSRINAPASEAAIGRLHEATGRPVLTAAASGKAAFEGYKGHGVFTWALLDALTHGDINQNGTIELSELAAHVQERVPKIGAELHGEARGFAVVADMDKRRQTARFGSRGEDFVLVRRLQ
jgi:WD40 repeat protein